MGERVKELRFPYIDLTHVDAVMLDLDNCLYPYEPTHSMALAACFTLFEKEFPRHLQQDAFNTLYRHCRTQVTERLRPQGCCRSRLLAFQQLFETLKIPQAWLHAKHYADHYWNTFVERMEPLPEAVAFVQRCREANIPICIVSDMEMAIQVRKLIKLGVEDAIEFMVTSEETGEEKPSAAIFECAWKKLTSKLHSLQKGHCIMVGDSMEKDVVGAQNFGVRGYWVEGL